MFKLVVCDMAGTTINDYDEVYRVLREATERAGAQYSDETFQEWMGTEKRYAITNLLRVGGVEPTEELVEECWQWFRAELERTYTQRPPAPLDGVEEQFAAWREAGVKVSLTTGFSREITDLILRNMGWSVGETIDAVTAGDEVENGRPEPDMILKNMEKLGITDPAEVISVGDTAADVKSAQAAGVTSVGVLTGHLTRAEFEERGADRVVDSVAKLEL